MSEIAWPQEKQSVWLQQRLPLAALAFVLFSHELRLLMTHQLGMLLGLACVCVGMLNLRKAAWLTAGLLFGGALLLCSELILLLPLLLPSLFLASRGCPLSIVTAALPVVLMATAVWLAFGLPQAEASAQGSLVQSFWFARAEGWRHPLLFLPFLISCYRWRSGWTAHPLYLFCLMFPAFLLLRVFTGTYQINDGFFALFPLLALFARGWTEDELAQSSELWVWLETAAFLLAAAAYS